MRRAVGLCGAIRRRRRLLLLAQLLGLVAEAVRLAQQRLLPGRVLLDVRLQPEQQVLVGDRLEVVALELDRLVLGLDARLDVLPLVGVGQAEVAVDLVPVVRGDQV